MRRLSGGYRSAVIIGLQGIRARKLRTLLSMISLFLGVLAVVTVQAGASIAERALLADLEKTQGFDGTKVVDVMPSDKLGTIVTDTVKGQPDATAMLTTQAIIGEPDVRPVNEGGSPFDQDWGGGMICYGPGPDDCQPEHTGPKGAAIEVRLSALTGELRDFRPLRPVSGEWLTFGTAPSLAPKLVINEEAAKGFHRHQVPAEMRIAGATANLTPQIIGVVDDGDYQPRAYVRLDELNTWMSPAGLGQNAQFQVLLGPDSPVEPVLMKKLKGAGVESYVMTVDAYKELESQLSLMRLIFLSMAGLVLLIGVAGILNVGLATVGERVEEFALRRAVGTPRLLLAGIVLAETLLTGLLTAAAAIGAGIAGLKVVSMVVGSSEPMLANVQFPWDAGVAGIIAGIVAGVLGGFIPALRAAGIPIATVMRA